MASNDGCFLVSNKKAELVRQQGTLEFKHFKILVSSGNLTFDFVKQQVLLTNFKEGTKRLETEWTASTAVRGRGEERKERWEEKPSV